MDQDVLGKRMVLSRNELPYTTSNYFKLLSGGQEIPVQFDDLDGDGKWDELAFECDLSANNVTKLALLNVDEQPVYEPMTQVYLGVSPERDGQFAEQDSVTRLHDHIPQSLPYLYQYEGPGWESDLVAFRSYFDSRNGKDIFGKTQPMLYVDQIGISDNYHELGHWGMDVLKVGNSLGAGALALLHNDLIYRLGQTATAKYRVITEGPVRSVFELVYTGWEVSEISHSLTERITIWAHKRSFESQVSLASHKADTLVTGIVNLKKVGKQEVQADGYEILYTHGIQSENKDFLGMGLLIPDENFISFGDTHAMNSAGVTDTYIALLKPDQAGEYTFHFYAGWELENTDFNEVEMFKQALLNEVIELNAEISVSIQ